MDDDWQLIYLSDFIAVRNTTYNYETFVNEAEKLQWYATIYNAGFDEPDDYISKKNTESNFLLKPANACKKFEYAAIAFYYFKKPAARK